MQWKANQALPQGLLHWGACYTLSFMHDSPVTETCVKRGSNRGQAPSAFYCSTEGVTPFAHCATSASSLRHQCRLTAPPQKFTVQVTTLPDCDDITRLWRHYPIWHYADTQDFLLVQIFLSGPREYLFPNNTILWIRILMDPHSFCCPGYRYGSVLGMRIRIQEHGNCTNFTNKPSLLSFNMFFYTRKYVFFTYHLL